MRKLMTSPNELPISSTDPVLSAPVTTYADQVAQIAIGPFVTKLTFGMAARPGSPPDPVYSVVMPTPQAKELAVQIMRILVSKDARQQLSSELQAWMDSLKE